MGRLWNKWLVPALFAVILFLCIRVANDIPKHEYYWESNEWNAEGYACGTLHVLSYLFSIEVLASFVPEAEVGMVAGIRGSCPDGSRLVSSDDVGHPLFDGGKS